MLPTLCLTGFDWQPVFYTDWLIWSPEHSYLARKSSHVIVNLLLYLKMDDLFSKIQQTVKIVTTWIHISHFSQSSTVLKLRLNEQTTKNYISTSLIFKICSERIHCKRRATMKYPRDCLSFIVQCGRAKARKKFNCHLIFGKDYGYISWRNMGFRYN